MIPGIDPDTFTIVIWGVAILVLAWTWVPALIASLGGTRYLTGGSNDVSRLDLARNGPDFAFWAKQIAELGYDPLGSGWLRVNFAGPSWALVSAVAIFRNQAKNTYAYMERAPAPYSFWPGAVFATMFSDGSALFTDNNRAAQPDPDDECVRQGVVTLKLAELEEFHQATLSALGKLNRKPDSDMSVELLLNTIKRFDGEVARRVHSRAGTQYLFAHGLIHITVSFPLVYLMGFMHWAVPLCNLILATAMLTGERAQKKNYAQAVRVALRQKVQ